LFANGRIVPTFFIGVHGGFHGQLWIVNSGTVFDNIIVTDSEAEAKAHADKHWKAITEGEKDAKEAFDKKKKEAEEAAKPKAAEPEDDEDDEEL
jgi:calreticulin